MSIKQLIVNGADILVAVIMRPVPLTFHTDDKAWDAVRAFEHYQLAAVPVVNLHEQPVGVLTLDKALEFINDRVGKERLEQACLRAEEDIFAPIWKSARNRWAWLALNVCTAFISSRIIGAFEDTIGQLVALASLMPIVASISGNTGNQTVALTLRGLALKQLHTENLRHVFFKELAVAVVNGVMWGCIVALFALAFYHQLDLALVIAAAMVLSLLVAALAGILIPVGLQRFGRNPVLGSSVLLTAITDATGFLLILGLASVWLR